MTTSSTTSPRVELHGTTPDLAPEAGLAGLKFAAAFTVASGLFFAIASTGATDGVVRLLLDIAFLRVDNGLVELVDAHHLTNAILGGVMAGWGVMIWMVVDRFGARAPGDVKSAIAVSIVVWFIIDSTGSIVSGGWVNALINVGYLALFLVPLRKL